MKPPLFVRDGCCTLRMKRGDHPWHNRLCIPEWAHGKRAVVEAERILTVQELTTGVCEYFDCEQTAHLKQHVS